MLFGSQGQSLSWLNPGREVTDAAIAAGKPAGSLPESQRPGPQGGKAGRVELVPVCLIYTFGPLEQLILETRFTQETQQVEMVGKRSPFSDFLVLTS